MTKRFGSPTGCSGSRSRTLSDADRQRSVTPPSGISGHNPVPRARTLLPWIPGTTDSGQSHDGVRAPCLRPAPAGTVQIWPLRVGRLALGVVAGATLTYDLSHLIGRTCR